MVMTKFPTEIGGFDILGILGQGGMGVVYCGRDKALQRELAIKVQSGDWRDHPERLKRFLREARILAKINHPNVVQIYTVGEHEGAPFFAMELLENSVADAARLKRPALAQTKRWILEAARGLAAIHDMDVVHRDIKPGNLLLTRATSIEGEHVKVADLGIASAGERFGAALTRGGAVLGTSGYLPPESFRLEHTLDARADQYSLGVVFFELLTGRPPYEDMSDVALMSAILVPRTPPDVRKYRPDVDPDTADVLFRMLQDDPDRRYPTSIELVQALTRIQDPSSELSARSAQAPASPTEPIPPAAAPSPRIPPQSPPPIPTSPIPPAAPPPTVPMPADAVTAQRRSERRPAASLLRWGLVAFGLVAIGLAGLHLAGFFAPAPPVAEGVDSLKREAWAKYLIGQYELQTKNGGDEWTLNLLDQDGGVIDAELLGLEEAEVQLTGRVEGHSTRTIDGEEWDSYRVKLLGPADIALDVELLFSDDDTDGSGSLIYYGDRTQIIVVDSDYLPDDPKPPLGKPIESAPAPDSPAPTSG